MTVGCILRKNLVGICVYPRNKLTTFLCGSNKLGTIDSIHRECTAVCSSNSVNCNTTISVIVRKRTVIINSLCLLELNRHVG